MKHFIRLKLFIIIFTDFTLAQFALQDVLGRYTELSNFTALINNSTTLSARLFGQLTNFTLLAPTNQAITAWLATNVSSADIDAMLEYHLLYGRYPTANITESHIPIRSWLSDTKYANVTDGQRVEVFRNESGVFFESGAKMDSKIVTGDIVGDGGFVHIIDKVLSIPSIFGVTAGQTHLAELLDILDRGNYLRNYTYSWDIATRRDSTFFAPNSAAALSHVPPIGSESFYNSLLEYHCVSELVYSSDMVDGMELPTFNKSAMIIRIGEDGQIFANNARIIGTNYLVFNGVMHILDDLMDPNNITISAHAGSNKTTTTTLTDTSSRNGHGRLSMGAKVGVAIGAGAVIILLATGLLLFHRRRAGDRKVAEVKHGSNCAVYEMDSIQVHEAADGSKRVHEPEPKTFLGPNDLEPKSLWIQRQRLRSVP